MTMKLATRCPTCFGELASDRSCAACADRTQPRTGGLTLATGTVLAGHYRIGQVLGKPGGFGITYLAWDERLETRVAIKEFFPRELAGRGRDGTSVEPHTESDDPLFEYGLEQFLNEARTLARFDHPNIVRVRHFFQENGTGYLVMDYYEGESLSAYLARQTGERLDEKLAIQILLPVLDGLRAVHAQGILHRDIDPHNIYLTTGNRVILLDFGAARMAVGDRSRSLSVILKPGYAPYEQYASTGKQGPWTDVYACAATLYRMVTGQVPPDALSRMMGEAMPREARLEARVSPRLGELLDRAMALKPQERLQTIDELRQALLAVSEPRGGGGEEEVEDPEGAEEQPTVMTPQETAEGIRIARRNRREGGASSRRSPAPAGRRVKEGEAMVLVLAIVLAGPLLFIRPTWPVMSLAIWISAVVLPGFHFRSFGSGIVVAALIGASTVGLFYIFFYIFGFFGLTEFFIASWISISILLKITDTLTDRLTIDSLGWILGGALVISVMGVTGMVVLEGFLEWIIW